MWPWPRGRRSLERPFDFGVVGAFPARTDWWTCGRAISHGLADRLSTTVHTQRLFRWHNLLFTFVVFFVVVFSKFLFAIPHFVVAMRSQAHRNAAPGSRSQFMLAMDNYLRTETAVAGDSQPFPKGAEVELRGAGEETKPLVRATS